MLVRPAAYARHRGVSRQAVHKAIKDQRIPTHNGLVDIEEADAAWSANTDPANPANSETGQPEISVPLEHRRPDGEDAGGQLTLVGMPQASRREAAVARQQANGTANGSKPSKNGTQPYGKAFASARADRETWSAKLAELDYQQRQGELIPIGEISHAWATALRLCRDQMLGIPDRLPPATGDPAAAYAARQALRSEIQRALEELAGAFEEKAAAAVRVSSR